MHDRWKVGLRARRMAVDVLVPRTKESVSRRSPRTTHVLKLMRF